MPREVLLDRDLLKVVHDLTPGELAQVADDLNTARADEARIQGELEALVAPKRAELVAAKRSRGRLEREQATGQRVTVHEVRREWDPVTDEAVIVDLADGSELERRPLAPGDVATLHGRGSRPKA